MQNSRRKLRIENLEPRLVLTQVAMNGHQVTEAGYQYVLQNATGSSHNPITANGISDATQTVARTATTSAGGSTHAELSDAFDGVLSFGVVGNRGLSTNIYHDTDGLVDVTTDATGTTVTSDPSFAGTSGAPFGGLELSSQFFFAHDSATIRALYTVTNTTSDPITEQLGTVNDLGSDAGTRISTTSSGDNTFNNIDRWWVSFQDYASGRSTDPRILWVREGTGTLRTPAASLVPLSNGDDAPRDGYTVTVQPGETQRILIFVGMDSSLSAAANAGDTTFDSNFDVQSAGLLAGLTQEELEQVVNWDFGFTDLSVTTTGASSVVAGSGSQNLTYTVTVTNNGVFDDSSVSLNTALTLPAGVTVASITPSQGKFDSSTGIWNLGTLEGRKSATLTFDVTVDQTAAAATNSISATGSILSSFLLLNGTSDDAATAHTSVTRNADLHVATTGTTTVVAGSSANNVQYTVTVTNNGPSNDTGITVATSHTLPAGATITSTTPSQGTFNASTGNWTIGALASGASVTLVVNATADHTTAPGANALGLTAAVSASDATLINPKDDASTLRTSVTRAADLSVGVGGGVGVGGKSVVAGSDPNNLFYTVTVTNHGPSDDTGVQVGTTYTLPAGVTITSTTASQGTFGALSDTWSVGTLANGASAMLTIYVSVAHNAAAANNSIVATASIVASNATLLNPSNDTATTSTSITRQVDLKVVATAPPTIVAGSGTNNLTYVVTVTNNGPSDASGVQLGAAYTLPAGVTIASVTPSVGTINLGTGAWTVGSLASGASATLTAKLNVAPNTAAGTNTISGTANVKAVNETLINTGNDTSAMSTSVTRQVDLKVVATAPATIVAGSGTNNLTYIVTVTNNGPSDASGVQLGAAYTLPAGVTIGSIIPSAGTVSLGTGTWTVGNLASGASATLTAKLTVAHNTAAGTNTISGTAHVKAVNETLINTSDDTSTTSTSVTRQVDLKVVATAPATIVAGSGTNNLTYVVTVTNNGPSDASGVQLGAAYTLPAGVTIGAVTPSAGSVNLGTGTWIVGGLVSGASATLTAKLTVAHNTAAGTNTISATANVKAVNETLINTSNDTSTTSTSVARQADLKVVATAPATIVAGSGTNNLTYVVTVTNNGPSDASGVQLGAVYTLPAGVTIGAITPSVGTVNVGTGAWTVGSLASGASATLTAKLTVAHNAAAGTNTISATANVKAVNETLTNTSDDTATTSTSVTRQVHLTVSAAAPSTVVAGSGPNNLTYVVTVTNHGPSDASGLELTAAYTLPTGVTIGAITPSTGTINASTGVWSVGNLAQGASATLTASLTAAITTAPAANVISGAAQVKAVNETLINTSDDSATTSTTVNSLQTLSTPFYRSYNPVTEDHFYTASLQEFQASLQKGYVDESSNRDGFSVLPQQVPGSLPVYRLFNLQTQAHYYTLSQGEHDILVALVPKTSAGAPQVGWSDEGIAGYMFDVQEPGTVPVYRLYNVNDGTYLLTSSSSAVNQILGQFPGVWVSQSKLGYTYPVASMGANLGANLSGTQAPTRTSSELALQTSSATASLTAAPASAPETTLAVSTDTHVQYVYATRGTGTAPDAMSSASPTAEAPAAESTATSQSSSATWEALDAVFAGNLYDLL